MGEVMVNTIRTAIHPFTIPWFVWRRNGPCGTNWSTARVTSVARMATCRPMRYTEVRMEKFAEAMMEDIDKETVDFQFNFDDSQEPTVMPTRVPQLLLNGSSGIAVGMATNMMPHNPNEVVDGCIAYIDNNDITLEELIKYVKAPDFPTGVSSTDMKA